nr:hypothetical protein L203_01384 [Cryptococcus depauperatus CBS 7841]
MNQRLDKSEPERSPTRIWVLTEGPEGYPLQSPRGRDKGEPGPYQKYPKAERLHNEFIYTKERHARADRRMHEAKLQYGRIRHELSQIKLERQTVLTAIRNHAEIHMAHSQTRPPKPSSVPPIQRCLGRESVGEENAKPAMDKKRCWERGNMARVEGDTHHTATHDYLRSEASSG